MSEPIRGRRMPWPEGLLLPSEYALGPDGNWHAMTPTGHLANLGGHEVTVHEDGTITVVPSIKVSTHRDGVDVELWHGHLERGVWRTC